MRYRWVRGSPPLVLLHGLFGSARNFGAVQRELSGHRRSMALDLRNHGSSPHDPDMRYTSMADDVVETLHELDAVPALLLGHSMGGKTAMQVALNHPDSVARLIVAILRRCRTRLSISRLPERWRHCRFHRA